MRIGFIRIRYEIKCGTANYQLTIPILGTIIPNMSIYHDALFTKTQQRVLSILFGQPFRSFYANEIIRLANCGAGAVQRELEKLLASQLITVSKIGNQKHFQANANSPIFNELHQIVLKTFGVADVLNQGLLGLFPQIEVAFIYGSVAKGLETANSDIDVMLVGNVSNQEVLTALEPVLITLARKINPTIYTLEEIAQRYNRSTPFVMRVLEQPKIFIKGSEAQFNKLLLTV